MLAYEWSNYRLASALMNGCKSSMADVLDPFEIEEGWFALDLSSFETVVGPRAPSSVREQVSTTIDRLGLRRREVVITRRRAAEQYWRAPLGLPKLPFWALERDEPFVASELRRQGRLNDEDR